IVVDTIADLQEEDQILAAQVELFLRPAEEEAALRRELALGVFANVPAALGLARRHADAAWLARRLSRPEDHLAGLLLQLGKLGRRLLHPRAELADRRCRIRADGDHRLDRCQNTG